MAELATAFVRVRPDLTGFKQEAAAGTRQAGHALGKVFALAFGTVAAEELARHVVTVAAQQDAMFAKIKQLTKSAGADWEVYGQTVQEAIIKKSEASGFAVDQLANAYGRLIQQTKDSRTALAYLTTASDVARARGTAVTQVATSLSRAYAGNAQALSRLGIIVPKYTAEQDAAKKKLQELTQAETYLAEVRRGVAPIKLDAQAQQYARLGEAQRVELKRTLDAQLQAAAASDKLVGAQKTLAEVGARFRGQGAIFGETAAGQADRFSISVHELEVSIGQHLIPLLGGAAEQGRKWATELEHSASVGHAAQAVAENLASGVRGAADAIASVYPAIKLTAEAISAVLSTVGAGPLLAVYGTYKGLVIVTGLYAKAEGRVVAARAAAAASAGAEAAATTAATVATEAQTVAVAENAAAQTALFYAEELQAAQQTILFTETVATTVAIEAQTVAVAEQGVAAEATTLRLGYMRAGLAAIGSGGVLLGIAAVVGGLYWLSTRTSDTERAVNKLRDAYANLNEAAKNVATVHRDVGSAGQAIVSSRIAREQAVAQLRAANAQLDTDYGASHPSAEKLRTDQLNIAAAADQWRRANQTLLDSEDAKRRASQASAKAIEEQKQRTDELITAQLTLAGQDNEKRVAGRTGVIISDGAAKSAATYAAQLRGLAEDTKKTTAAQRFNLQQLADYTEAIGKIPSEKTIRLTLNDTSFYNKLQKDLGVIRGAAAAFAEIFTGGPDTANAAARGAAALPPETKRKLTVDVADATISGVTQAGPSIATQVARAFRDAVLQAKQALVSIGDTLGGQIGQLLDAQLAASEAKLASSPIARDVKRLTEDAARLQARISARDQKQTVDTTLATLQKLQAAFGPGAHTAEQDAQLAAARNAYLDAQDQTQIAADTTQATHLQKRLDDTKAWLEKRNASEKSAAARRIADLNEELNRGLISERQYAARLPGILESQGVHFKSAGHLLGKAFADGFQENLAGAIAQARKIAELTPAERGRGSGGAPIIVDPRKVAQTTRQSLTEHASTQATARNTADTVAELKKLGAVIDKQGTRIHITIPPDVSQKDAAHIVKLAKALR